MPIHNWIYIEKIMQDHGERKYARNCWSLDLTVPSVNLLCLIYSIRLHRESIVKISGEKSDANCFP